MTNIVRFAPGSFASGGWSTSAQAGFSTADIALFNSLASGSCVVASSGIDNSTFLDTTAEIGLELVGSGATTTASYIGVYLLPLNRDGTTYGDGTPSGSQQSVVPAQHYWVGNMLVRSGVSAGTTLTGTMPIPRDLPRTSYRLAIAPTLGNALASSAAAVIAVRTTNANLNG